MWGGDGLIRSEIRPVFDFVFQAWLNFLTVGVGTAVKDEIVPFHAIEEYTENGGDAALHLNLDIRWRSESSFTSRTFDLRINSPSLPTVYQTGWAAEAVWAFSKINIKKKLPVRAGIYTLVHPASNLAIVFLVWTSSIILYRQQSTTFRPNGQVAENISF